MHAFEHASRATRGARNYQEDTEIELPGNEAEVSPVSSMPASSNGSAQPLVAVLADGKGGQAGGAQPPLAFFLGRSGCGDRLYAGGPIEWSST